jgi:hypothetical protein
VAEQVAVVATASGCEGRSGASGLVSTAAADGKEPARGARDCWHSGHGLGQFGGVEMRAAQLRRELKSFRCDLGTSPGTAGERRPPAGYHGAVLCHRARPTKAGCLGHGFSID